MFFCSYFTKILKTMQRKLLSTIIIFLLVFFQVNAQGNFARLKLEAVRQAPNLIIRDTDTDGSGNLYVTGFFSGTVSIPTSPTTTDLVSAGGTDIFVMKINPSGNIEWAFRIGAGSDDRVNAIKVDKMNNRLIVAGHFAGNGVAVSVGGSLTIGSYLPTDTDAFFVAYDLSKGFNDTAFAIAAKVIGGANFQTLYALEVDNGGRVYVGGYYEGTCVVETLPSPITLPSSGTGYEGWLACYVLNPIASLFEHQWSARVGAMNANDNVYDISVDAGFCYVVGYATNGATISGFMTILTASSSGNAFLTKLNASNGSVLDFVNIAEGSEGSDALAVKADNDVVVVAGTFGGASDFNPSPTTTDLASAGGRDVFVAKYRASSIANLLWVARVGGASTSTSTWDELGSLALHNGDVMLSVSHLGNATFNRKFGGSVSGISNITGNNFDGTLLKLSGERGDLLWYHTLSGSGEDRLRSVAVFNDNEDWFLWTAGNFQNVVDFDFEPNNANTLNGNTGANFYALYRFKLPQAVDLPTLVTNTLPDGRIQLSAQTDVSLPEVIFVSSNTRVAQIDNANILTIIPTFEEDEALIRAFHLGNHLYLPTDTVVVMKVSSHAIINHLPEDWEKQISISPNPATDYFVLDNKNSAIVVQSIEIFDTFGKKVTSLLHDTRYPINDLSKGIYYLHIHTNKGVIRRKIVKI